MLTSAVYAIDTIAIIGMEIKTGNAVAEIEEKHIIIVLLRTIGHQYLYLVAII